MVQAKANGGFMRYNFLNRFILVILASTIAALCVGSCGKSKTSPKTGSDSLISDADLVNPLPQNISDACQNRVALESSAVNSLKGSKWAGELFSKNIKQGDVTAEITKDLEINVQTPAKTLVGIFGEKPSEINIAPDESGEVNLFNVFQCDNSSLLLLGQSAEEMFFLKRRY